MKDLGNIKNLVFDLGNVLLDVDPKLTIDAFKSLGIDNTEANYSFTTNNDLFLNFEVGNISESEFRKKLKHHANKNINDQEFDAAWNAMLLTIPENRLNLLLELRKSYNLYLLSNTNCIHYKAYSKSYHGIFDVLNSTIFIKLYFSHIIHMRKPDQEIFKHLIDDAKIEPHETLFFDDLQINLNAAEKAEINTVLINEQNDIVSFFGAI